MILCHRGGVPLRGSQDEATSGFHKFLCTFVLTIDSETADLASAIGDKEVAAKAVAFVVNSTRKGIVPLCADVANIIRAKRR